MKRSILSQQETVNLSKPKISAVLIVVISFGLLTGTVEGVGSLVMQHFQLQAWDLFRSPTPEIVWICPVFDVILAALVGLMIAGIGKIFPRTPTMRLVVFLLSAMLFFDWLTFSGYGRQGRYFRSAGFAFLSCLAAGWVANWFESNEAAALGFCRRMLPRLVMVTIITITAVTGGAWLSERWSIATLPPVKYSNPLNVLVVIFDTTRADHLSAYGYSRQTSPNLEQLARQGVLFENAFAASSWTLPSHASMLTGRYPPEHGAERRPFDGRWPTIAQVMRSNGYLTAAFSANTLFFNRQQGFGRGFIHFEDYSYPVADLIVRTNFGSILEASVRRSGLMKNIVRRNAASVNSGALRWIDKHRNKPFLIFLNYFDAHNPYSPPRAYQGKFSGFSRPEKPVDVGLQMNWLALSPQQLQDEIDNYDESIAYADSELGSLISELKKRELLENTVVVVTADHGEMFGGHGLFLHGNGLYMSSIRVPLVVIGPAGLVSRGVRIQAPVTNVALPATIMDLLGMANNTFPGPSLREAWNGPNGPLFSAADLFCVESDLAANPMAPPSPVREGSLRSLVTPDWHYILPEKLGPELYDWRNDPQELQNLVGTPSGRTVSVALRQRIESGCSPAPAAGTTNRAFSNPILH